MRAVMFLNSMSFFFFSFFHSSPPVINPRIEVRRPLLCFPLATFFFFSTLFSIRATVAAARHSPLSVLPCSVFSCCAEVRFLRSPFPPPFGRRGQRLDHSYASAHVLSLKPFFPACEIDAHRPRSEIIFVRDHSLIRPESPSMPYPFFFTLAVLFALRKPMLSRRVGAASVKTSPQSLDYRVPFL